MSIRTQVRALRVLHESIDWGDEVGNVMRYAAVKVIWKDLDEAIDKLPPKYKPEIAGYVLEKLALFYSYMHYTVMPSEGTAHTPEGWWEAAGEQLYKVESHLGDFEHPNQ